MENKALEQLAWHLMIVSDNKRAFYEEETFVQVGKFLQAGGLAQEAADELGMSRSTLFRRLTFWGIGERGQLL
jgi:transcriptional regulator of acetoin/glycerol metabolism